MRRASTLLLGAVLAFGVPAQAQTQAQAESVAEALFQQARAEMKSGAYATACPKLAQSQRLDPSPGTLLNLAICEERLGRVATAWVQFHAFLDTVDPADPRVAVAREHIAALDSVLPRLKISLAPEAGSGVVVRLNDAELGAAGFGVFLPIDPGEHRIDVSDAQGRTRREVVRVALGERAERTLSFGPAEPPAPPQQVVEPQRQPEPSAAAPEPGAQRPSSEGMPSLAVMGLIVAGTGVAAFGVGTALALQARSLNEDSNAGDHCNARGCDDMGFDLRREALQKSDLATGFFIGGAVLSAGGVALYFVGREGRRNASPVVAVAYAAPTGAGIQVGRRF